ncbi:MAG: adenylosuccinate synthase, partial [Blastocatellia bacterium]|nr:adenylosuccinate synthase [Blastocatellia bacterium]
DRKFILRLIPSGIIHSGKTCVIGNGVVVDAGALEAEMEELCAVGIEARESLLISDRANLILPYHRATDKASEEARGEDKVGTTLRGIGPTYEDKIARRGLRAGDLLDMETFRTRVEANLLDVKRRLQADGTYLEESKHEYDSYFKHAKNLRPLVRNTAYYLNNAIKQGKNILFEGAQGTMLDIDHGTFPFVTSSNSTTGGAITGTGIAPNKITGVLGISKAYTTRVGSGPFPTELKDETGEQIRRVGKEFGAVTGRPRRTGWFDGVVARYSVMLNGMTAVAITKLDVLDHLPDIKVCVGYKLRGETLEEIPSSAALLSEVEPIYRTFPGWQENTSGLKDYNNLPVRARDYLKFLEDFMECSIGLISTGPERDQTIVVAASPLQGWLS